MSGKSYAKLAGGTLAILTAMVTPLLITINQLGG